MRLEVDQLLAADGPLAAGMEGFETRPEQVAMARAVQDALGTPHHLLVEAGTGVGKSFAYLLPAVAFATDRRRRVLVSTRTIALQEQLIAKDIPFLQSTLPVAFTAVLVKGRGNYLSRRRLGNAMGRMANLFGDDCVEIFLQPEVLNVFNESARDGGITTINVLNDFNPYTTTPVEGVDWSAINYIDATAAIVIAAFFVLGLFKGQPGARASGAQALG